MPNLISKENTASDFRGGADRELRRAKLDGVIGGGDIAYRSKANEQHLGQNGLRSQIHRKKPQGRPMPATVA